MEGLPPDLVDPIVPAGVPRLAQSSVDALARSAVACAEAADQLPLDAEAWVGPAAQAFAERRHRLLQHLADLDVVASRAATTIAAWSNRVEPHHEALVRWRARLLELQVQDAAAFGAGIDTSVVQLQAELAEAIRGWRTASTAYQVATAELAGHLLGLRAEIVDRRLTVGDHVAEFAGTVWQQGIVEPVRSAWDLTGQVFVDPQAWRDDVEATVDGWFTAIGEAWHHPWRTVRETASGIVDAPAWRSGHYGEGLGAAAVLLLPTPKWLRAGPKAGLRRWEQRSAHRRPIGSPLPRLQTVEELLTWVDLSRHEHPDLGHTLDRHVEVDDDYLIDRLTYGTITPAGTRSFIPPFASRFADRATAEAVITRALQGRAAELRLFAAGHGSDVADLTLRVDEDIGVTVVPTRRGFVRYDVREVFVRLRRNSDGSIYIMTAFPKELP